MSLYNGMFEASKALKGGLDNLKEKKDFLRQMAINAKENETVQSAGPALGKMAKFAAYPAGLGAGVGVGAWAAGAGASSAIDSTGKAFKGGWTPTDAKDAGMKFFGVLLFIVFAALALYVYKEVTRK